MHVSVWKDTLIPPVCYQVSYREASGFDNQCWIFIHYVVKSIGYCTENTRLNQVNYFRPAPGLQSWVSIC